MTIAIRKAGHCKHCGRKLGADDLVDECDDALWCIGESAHRDDATRDDAIARAAIADLIRLSDAWAERDRAFAASIAR